MPNLQKAAGILIKDGTLLVCRTRGKDTFFAPGGRLEAGEAARSAAYVKYADELLRILKGINPAKARDEVGTEP
jgi:ADP-ribose pyrophosphatase YjhB (NUDIX family)